MKKILSLFIITLLLVPQITFAAPFFKEKEVVYQIPKMTDDAIVKARKLSTHYRINKITATDVFYTKFVDGVLDLTEENKKVPLANFDDNTKFKVIDIEYIPITVAWNSGTKKWAISNEIFFTKTDAAAALTDFVFAPLDMNGKPWAIRIDDPALVRKSKL